jgi:hypothetical protein
MAVCQSARLATYKWLRKQLPPLSMAPVSAMASTLTRRAYTTMQRSARRRPLNHHKVRLPPPTPTQTLIERAAGQAIHGLPA